MSVEYEARCEGGPMHGKRLSSRVPLTVVPILPILSVCDVDWKNPPKIQETIRKAVYRWQRGYDGFGMLIGRWLFMGEQQ